MVKAFEIKRNDAAEATTYVIDGQEFTVRDLRWGRIRKELPAQVDGIVSRLGVSWSAEHADGKAALADVMGACASEFAALWAWFCERTDGPGAEWFDEHATLPRVAQVYAQLVKDNRLEGFAKLIEERYLPFVLRVAETRAMAQAAESAATAR
jgi:hypothetical protein